MELKCAPSCQKALCRPLNVKTAIPLREMEAKALAVNDPDIGLAGFGGNPTAIKVNIASDSHSGLPVAVNVGCHVTRHASCVL